MSEDRLEHDYLLAAIQCPCCPTLFMAEIIPPRDVYDCPGCDAKMVPARKPDPRAVSTRMDVIGRSDAA